MSIIKLLSGETIEERREPSQQEIIAALKAATEELRLAREHREQFVALKAGVEARFDAIDEKLRKLDERCDKITSAVEPLSQMKTRGEGAWKMLGIIIAVIGGIGATIGAVVAAATWLKLHVFAGAVPSPVR